MEAGRLFKSVLLDTDLLARIGSDEFAVFLDINKEEVEQTYHNIHGALRQYNVHTCGLPLSISVGYML